jgi:glycosyltransferase involved in cell wall biosynthesis
MPKLSIITINYNNYSGLAATIDSILGQNFKDYEFIIIDGGSTDGSVEVIKKQEEHITCWVSEKDKGIYNAQNKGIKRATGEYCLFLNSGDFLADNNVLQKIFSYRYSQDIIYGNMILKTGKGRLTHCVMPDVITFYQMYTDTLWHPVSFIKKQLFERLGYYNEQYKMVADYDFFFKAIIMNNVSTIHVNVEVCVYNLNGFSSLPENKNIEKLERMQVLKSYLPLAVIDFAGEQVKKMKKKENTGIARVIKKLKHL